MVKQRRRVRTGEEKSAKPILLGLVFLFAALGVGFADNSISADLRPMLSFVRMPEDDDLVFTGLADAGVTFSAKGNKNVKAELDVDLTVGENVLFDVSRAYIKVRFPGFRSTLGKNRISWGEGVMFNAGDLIAATSGFSTDLTREVFHDRGVWMAEGYIPFGRFAFGEIVVLPPVPTLFPIELTTALRKLTSGPAESTATDGATSTTLPSIKDTAGGGRIYLKPLGIKTEAGYLFEGAEEAADTCHTPYLSLQWHLLVDWQVSASTVVPGEEPEDTKLHEEVWENTKISWGLFHTHNFRSGASLSLRLESMVRPNGSWGPVDHTPENNSDSEMDPAADTTASSEEYGILFYPEIVFSPTSSLSFIARSVFSPIDASGLFTLGTGWNVYQGFSLLGFISLQAGGQDDLFGWDRNGDVSFSLGMEFSY